MEESSHSESLTTLSILTIAIFVDNALRDSIPPQSQFDKLAEPGNYNVTLACILKDATVKPWIDFLASQPQGNDLFYHHNLRRSVRYHSEKVKRAAPLIVLVQFKRGSQFFFWLHGPLSSFDRDKHGSASDAVSRFPLLEPWYTATEPQNNKSLQQKQTGG